MSPRKQKDSIKWMGGLGGLFRISIRKFLGRSIYSFQKMDLTPPTPQKYIITIIQKQKPLMNYYILLGGLNWA
tara:strand:+ start:5266 stop:5484 length:219 start_codon:yes stop_codon:yes gene_type:complete